MYRELARKWYMFVIPLLLTSCNWTFWKKGEEAHKAKTEQTHVEVSIKDQEQGDDEVKEGTEEEDEDTVTEAVNTLNTLESGLQYQVLNQVDSEAAATPKSGDNVTVHYVGWLEENGVRKEFDSSHWRGQPFSFTVGVGKVIKGWDEGIMRMKEGEKCKFVIPPHLAYGDRGAGNVIPPKATLFFEVELLKAA